MNKLITRVFEKQPLALPGLIALIAITLLSSLSDIAIEESLLMLSGALVLPHSPVVQAVLLLRGSYSSAQLNN